MTTTTPGGPLPTTSPTTAPATTSKTMAMPSRSATTVVPAHDHHSSGDHSTTTTIAGSAITLTRLDRTTFRVRGVGFPAGKRAKVVLSDRRASRSVVTHITPTGRFTVLVNVPPTWAGTLRAVATANSGSVYARKSLRLN